MKIAAISQRVDEYPDRNERRDAIDKKLVQFLLVAGYMPVPVPNDMLLPNAYKSSGQQAISIWVEKIKPQAVLLSGGNDITECAERDATEAWLLDYASEHRLPVLGICRGMQMIGVWAGAELKPVAGHVRSRHVLTGEISAEVNSYHNQAIASCPDEFSVLARSEDGEIEAIRHNNLPWQGWMWHPEREEAFLPEDIQRIQALFGD